jgi:hypothetical protein
MITITSIFFQLAGPSLTHQPGMDDDLGTGDLFQDPEGFYPDEKQPTFAEHRMLSGQTVRVRLVGNHPLYVRRLQNSRWDDGEN